MIYEYNISTNTIWTSFNTIWTSFDYGEVEADSSEEAKIMAAAIVKEKLAIANFLLEKMSYTIGMDLSQLEITLKK